MLSGLAPVLGLLIASAKSSYDTQSGHIKQITANVILLDRLLAKYGPEARRIREDLRESLNPLVARINRARKARLRSDDQPPFAEHAYKSGRPVERLKQELSRMVLDPNGSGLVLSWTQPLSMRSGIR